MVSPLFVNLVLSLQRNDQWLQFSIFYYKFLKICVNLFTYPSALKMGTFIGNGVFSLNTFKLFQMKKVLFIASVVLVAGLLLACQTDGTKVTEVIAKPTLASIKTHETTGPINWMTWEEAVKANKKTGKKIFIDFYTDWCGWCKKMDASTFADPDVAKYVNENFYPVKFNAEQKEDVVFNGTTFSFQNQGRRGAHALAVELLDGRLGYPSYVYLTPTFERILISPGYKPVSDMKKELQFVAEDHYTSTSWEEYKKAK